MDDLRPVKKIKSDHQGGDHNLESAWRTFRDILTQNLDRIGDMGTYGHNEGVFLSTQSSLDILQQKWPGDCKVTASEVF